MEKDYDPRYAAFELHKQVEALGMVWKNNAVRGQLDMAFTEISDLTQKARAFVDVLEVRLPELMEVLVKSSRAHHAGAQDADNMFAYAIKRIGDEAAAHGFSADEAEFLLNAALIVDPNNIDGMGELYRHSESMRRLDDLGLQELPSLLLEPSNDILPFGGPSGGKEKRGKR